MDRSRESRKESTGEKTKPLKPMREMLYLAEQAAEGKLKVLPGTKWSIHYTANQVEREEKLQGLLTGKYSSSEVSGDIAPDALVYDTADIEKEGLEKVSGRIRDLSAFISHYDHPRFARFVESMRGRDVSLKEIENLYNEMMQARVQKQVMDSYGYTGRKQIEEVLRAEANHIARDINGLSGSQKVLKALKMNWLSEELGLISMEERDRMLADLSGNEREQFEILQSQYRDFVHRGDEKGYQELTNTIREGLMKIRREGKEGEVSESMRKLEEELKDYKDQAVPPGSPKDLAIPPEDHDEYHTPPPAPGESKEKTRERAIFEIDPALGGYYISGRKSYFDIGTKTWSKKKQLSDYSESISGKVRSNLTGVVSGGLISLPIPNGYALDAASLKVQGANIAIKRDQNGCFYLDAQGNGSFSIQFTKETHPFAGMAIPEDKQLLYRGSLSEKTESFITKLIGSPIQMAEQARQFILANHFYPGGGDLQLAQALQYKLRTESSGENYLQNIDASEYLECYSANTKFIAIMRKAGVSARLVVGHKVEGAKNGKSSITQSTGHAWSEVWDGQMWRRFDATPNPKPEDKQKNNEGEKKQPAPEAQDGGIDKPDTKGERKSEKTESSSDSGSPLQKMDEASEKEMKQSEDQLEEIKDQLEAIEEQRQKISEKTENADSFKELADLQKEIQESDLFDDMKKDLEDKLEAKMEQKKDQIKDELDKMVEDGFLDEKKRDEMIRNLEEKRLEELDRVQKEIERENRLFNEYELIREEVSPLVDKWFLYFAERLPRQEEVSFDEDSLTRQGAFNRRAVMKTRNLLFGTVKNPREIRPSIKPRFLASILVDVSGSMQGEKLQSARKLVIFYSELFSRISQEFGYIRFSIDIFSDTVKRIKGFEQDYDSSQQYDFGDGDKSTVKVRAMKRMTVEGGTNMLNGIKNAAYELNKQVEEFPDYASAFYFVGDGGDTHGNANNIVKFLKTNEVEHGFGEHMYSAILLGSESQRRELANIFGDEHTNVAPNFDDLIEKSMEKFDDDLEEYLRTKTQ